MCLIKRLYLLSILALVLCLCSMPATADILFSDLGPAGNVYGTSSAWAVSGSGYIGTSFTAANLFTVADSGSLSVTEIDLAVSSMGPPDTFYATIWTDNAGLPGAQVAGAYWNPLYATTTSGCCGLVSITGITGVTLTGGDQYFMILGPLAIGDDSWNGWYSNNQGVDGLDLYSENGGSTCVSTGIKRPHFHRFCC
jgi:hypothetical protein